MRTPSNLLPGKKGRCLFAAVTRSSEVCAQIGSAFFGYSRPSGRPPDTSAAPASGGGGAARRRSRGFPAASVTSRRARLAETGPRGAFLPSPGSVTPRERVISRSLPRPTAAPPPLPEPAHSRRAAAAAQGLGFFGAWLSETLYQGSLGRRASRSWRPPAEKYREHGLCRAPRLGPEP